MIHSEICGCAECVDSYSASGQTDPYGLTVSVEWELCDRIAHATWSTPDGSPPENEWVEEMDALVRRIEGRRFDSADDLVAYLRQVTGSRDFD